MASFLLHHPQARVLDVRFTYERAAGHLPHDHHVPWYAHGHEVNPAFIEEARQALDPAHPVLVVCRNGRASCEAAARLEAAGFGRVYNVLGGYEEIAASARLHSNAPGAARLEGALGS